MDDIQQLKAEVRRRMRRVLAGIGPQQWQHDSAAVCTRLLESIALANGGAGAGVVMFYMATARELDVGPAAVECLRRGIEVCLPRANWGAASGPDDGGMPLGGKLGGTSDPAITPCLVSSWGREELVETRHGIFEPPPTAKPVDLGRLDLIVVPGLAFDASGGRLGKGGGFYDRFLSQPGLRAARVGIGLDVQVVGGVESVPRDTWDVALDALVTPTRTMVFGATGSR